MGAAEWSTFRNAQSVLQLVRKQVNTHTHTRTRCTDAQTAAEMCLDIKQIVKNTAPPHGQIAFEREEEEEETIFLLYLLFSMHRAFPTYPPPPDTHPPISAQLTQEAHN